MADRTQIRTTERDEDIAQDDPFAELTRIMGFDPRVPSQPESQAPAQGAQASAQGIAEADFAIDLEKELMGEFGEEFSEPETPETPEILEEILAETLVPEAGYAQPQEPRVEAEPFIGGQFDQADPLDKSLADELFFDEAAFAEEFAALEAAPADFISDGQPDLAEFDALFAEEASTAPVAEADFLTGLEDALSHEFPETEMVQDEFPVFDDAEFSLEAAEPDMSAAEPVEEAFDESVFGDSVFGDNGDEFEQALAAAVFKGAVAEDNQPEPEPVVQAQQVSLEDELNALLGSMSSPAQPAYEPEFQLEQPLDVHAEPTPPSANPPSSYEATYEEQEQEPAPAPFAASATMAAASVSGAAAQNWGRSTPFIRPQQQEPEFSDFAQDYVASAPAHTASAPAQDMSIGQPVLRHTIEEMPELETIDIAEKAVAVADDLDIPDISFEDEKTETPAYDDFDAEFASLMNEMSEAEPAPAAFEAPPRHVSTYGQAPAMAATSDQPVDDDADPVFSNFDYQDYAAAPYDEEAPYAESSLSDDGFDYEPDAGEMAQTADSAGEPPSRNRMVLVAAAIGAVALLGGLGAFALSFGGGDSGGTPVLVKADDSPIKIKPENPGGTVIPNQDNKVYDMVANGAAPVAPTQETLVSDAEQPVDVAARMPQIVDNETPAKSEERVAPTLIEDEIAADATPTVVPRKVRTMVVRPDGTLVPREEPQIAATEPADPAPQQVTAPDAAPDAAQTAALPPAVAPDAAPRPAEPPAQDVAEASSTTGPTQVAALDTQAAAPGTWAMQIASQPSAEAAQSTYQDLAGRYASVLQGRSVNIVKAEIAGKGTFYRVRVGAETRADAISLCERYKAAGGACFVSQ
ncbi:SPOR domain-containing protein [Aquamicrobium segne]|uniref:SPOR domain-containing protein n=1 Tax=Aquamicrobium segne TaxID=469547 RepID=A0ABW0GY16_9HYPH